MKGDKEARVRMAAKAVEIFRRQGERRGKSGIELVESVSKLLEGGTILPRRKLAFPPSPACEAVLDNFSPEVH
jgi:hypothetical protein